MRKMLLFGLIIVLAISFIACKKSTVNNDSNNSDAPPGARINSLISVTWGIKSANSIDSLSIGTLNRYKGSPLDTLIFLWGLNPNKNIHGISSTIMSVNYQTGVSKISPCSYVTNFDTTNIAYDTVICTGSYRPHYSDTLFISKISDNFLVFRIRYSFGNTSGVEMDSLYRVHFR